MAVLLPFPTDQALAAAGGPEHRHGPEEVAGAVQAHPRFVAESEIDQLVGVFRDGRLTLYPDRQADNGTLTDAAATLEIGGQAVAVEALPDGTYRATPDSMPSTGEAGIFITIGGSEPDPLVGNLTLETASQAAAGGHGAI